MMTPRERVLTAMRRQVPDRVPRRLEYGSFVEPLMEIFYKKTGAEDPAEYYNYEIRDIDFNATKRRYGLEKYIPENIPKGAFIDWEWGNIEVSGHYKNITRVLHYALEDAEAVEDIEAYPMPDILEPYRWSHIKGLVKDLHNRNLAAMGCMSQTIFEVAWGARGFEDLLIDFMVNKPMAELLLDRVTDMRCGQARIFAEADIDVLRLGDDVGTERGMMISPATFREWLKPRFAKIIKAAREVKPDILVFYHSDGDCREVITDLIEIGIDILNPVQPECMNPAEIKLKYGDKLAFWGTIANQTTMPFGTPDDVKREVKERIETVGRGGGLLLTPSHLLQAEVPWENVIAFFEAVDEYGVYEK